MEFEELIKVLAAETGLGESLTIDAENRCLVAFDGMEVALQGVDTAGQVHFFASLGEPPPERLEALYRGMLEANHLFRGTAGATLSLDPETGVAYLCRALACAALDGETFLAELENFVNTVEAWRRLVSDYRDHGAAPAAADVPPGDGEFLRV